MTKGLSEEHGVNTEVHDANHKVVLVQSPVA